MKLAIVAPAYNEEEGIREFYEQALEYLNITVDDYQLIVVDDGSTDRTWEILQELGSEQYLAIRHESNLGQEVAIIRGIKEVREDIDVVVVMDSDLQHPFHIIEEMVDAYAAGAKVVHTVRNSSDDVRLRKKIVSKTFYLIYNLYSKYKLVGDSANFKLIDRRLIRDISSDKNTVLRVELAKLEVPQTAIAYQAHSRFAGRTKYNLSKNIRLAWQIFKATTPRWSSK